MAQSAEINKYGAINNLRMMSSIWLPQEDFDAMWDAGGLLLVSSSSVDSAPGPTYRTCLAAAAYTCELWNENF